jgi:phage repressor protein C with HTH and peptisase S24 domain
LSEKKSKKAGREAQYKIAKALGYSIDDFIRIGRSIMETGMPSTPPIAAPPTPIIIQTATEAEKEFMLGISDRYQAIPLYESGKLAAGVHGAEFDPYEVPDSMVVVYQPELRGCSNHHLAALKVGGDSMEPTIIRGAIVVVDLDDKEYSDRRIFIVNAADMMASVKRVGKWERGFFLSSDNPKYGLEPTALDWHELCVGRVVWQWKDMREG